MFSLVFIIVHLAISVSETEAAQKLPSFVRPCKRTFPLSSCVKNVIEELRPHLLKGIPRFKVPSLDPLYLDELQVSGNDPLIGEYNGTLRDIQNFGINDFQVIAVEVDIDNLFFRLKFLVPSNHWTASVAMKGVVFGSLFDNDDFTAELDTTNVFVDFSANGKLYIKNGDPHIRWVDSGNSRASYGKAIVNVVDLFEDPVMNSAFIKTMNENVFSLYPHFLPAIRNSVTQFLLGALNSVHEAYSIDVLYPL